MCNRSDATASGLMAASAKLAGRVPARCSCTRLNLRYSLGAMVVDRVTTHNGRIMVHRPLTCDADLRTHETAMWVPNTYVRMAVIETRDDAA